MEYRYRHLGSDYTIQLESLPDGTITARIGDRRYSVEVQRAEGGQFTLLIDGKRTHVYAASCDVCQTGLQLRYVALVDREAQVYELERPRESAQRRASAASGGSLEAQMPGQVRQVLVSEGDKVEAGQALLILEAMKMEIRVSAPSAGTVAKLLVREGETVERGQPLAEVTSKSE